MQGGALSILCSELIHNTLLAVDKLHARLVSGAVSVMECTISTAEGTAPMTMAGKIRFLLAKGWSSREIADHLELPDTAYICRIRWYDAHPGYKRNAMRKLRANPDYLEREYDAAAVNRKIRIQHMTPAEKEAERLRYRAYRTEWMRRRRQDPAYRERERMQQRAYYHQND